MLWFDEVFVAVGAAVAEELPGVACLLDFIEVEVGDDEFVLVAGGFGDELARRIAEVGLAVEFADAPRLFGADAVDGSDEVAVGDAVGGLLEFPEIFAEAGDGGGGVEDDFGSVESEGAGSFGEVAVIADVDADGADFGFENGIAEVAGAEVELFPEARVAMGDVIFAVFAEISSVGVDDGGGVVVDAFDFDFVDGNDEDHLMFFRQLTHQLGGGSVGDLFGDVVPAGFLFGAKVGAVEELLEAENLHALFGGLFDHGDMFFDHGVTNGGGVFGSGVSGGGLNEAGFDDARHKLRSVFNVEKRRRYRALRTCRELYYPAREQGMRQLPCQKIQLWLKWRLAIAATREKGPKSSRCWGLHIREERVRRRAQSR